MRVGIKRNTFERILVFSFIIIYSLAASLVSIHRFWQYNAFWYDFGIFDETIWKLSRLQIPTILQLAPPLGKIVWADHFNPSAAILAPLYWFTEKQEIILVAQVVFVAFSAYVAYLISLKCIRRSIVRISLVVSYLGFVGLQNALFTDVHNVVFALPPFMLLILTIYQKKWKLFFLFLLITLGFQENMAGVGLGIGMFLLLRRDKNIKIGILAIIISVLYAGLVTKILIPILNNGTYAYQPAIPTVWYGWILRFFSPKIKLKSIFLTFANFGFLPVLVFPTFPLIIEHYLERFVLNTAGTRWDLGFHYNALLSPIMFLASIEFIKERQNKRFFKKILPIWSVITILVVVFLHRFYLHGPLMLATRPIFYRQTKDARFLDAFFKEIPTDGLLMTQNNLATHFTHEKVVLLSIDYQRIKPDTIAIDIRPGQNPNNFFPLKEDKVLDLVGLLSEDTNYTRKEITDSQLIFVRR